MADLRDNDRLYTLPLTGDQAGREVYVRMRDGSPPLLFGTACSTVNSVALPRDWDGVCLEYTDSQGERITGVFPHGTVDVSTPSPKSETSE